MTAPDQDSARRQFRTVDEIWATYFPKEERRHPHEDLDPKAFGAKIAREAIEKAIQALENKK